MLDPKLIRADLNAVAEQLKKRNFDLDVATAGSTGSKTQGLPGRNRNLSE